MYHRVVVLREVTQTIGHKVSTNKETKNEDEGNGKARVP